MKRMGLIGVLALTVGCLVLGGVYTTPSSAGGNGPGADIPSNLEQPVDTTVSLTTLVKAINASGLAGTLKGTGPYTVFAPTDDAFKKLPNWDALQSDQAKLKAILLNHVVKGSLTKGDLLKMKTATTLQGGALTFRDNGLTNGLAVNNARVITSNPMAASNGIIYVIDTVLLPKGM